MITAKIIDKHTTEVIIDDDTKLLYSYGIPASALLNGVYYKTKGKISSHISKSVNIWTGKVYETKPQLFFDTFLTRF